MSHILSLPPEDVFIDRAATRGPLEWWRQALGHGGINALPLPPRVVAGVAKLQPRLIRVFIQEHFDIYPERGRLNWRQLDPFMEALARTGAKVVAAITIKPKVLFPKVDPASWRPNDVAQWQRVIYELTKRYSVDKPIVTHWEVGNETDIGESGGCPYLIPDPKDYAEYYRMTIEAVLAAFPSGKVGGPASCWIDNQPLPGLIEACRDTGTRLDFISWHLYHDDPQRHALGVEKAKQYLRGLRGPRPEMLVTEWNKSFEPVSCEELAFAPRRAANVAASLLAMLEAGLDWSFYYHIWDQVFHPDPFRPFFSEAGIHMMETHWNEQPHRFGLFGVGGEVRPQYFVYQMLSRLGEERIAGYCEDPNLHVLAAQTESRVSALLVNFGLDESRDILVTARFAGLTHGRKMLTIYRLDSARRWCAKDLEQIPLERREVYASDEFHCQVYCPRDSVALVTLEDIP
jgi:xylan 1,4-beta-xylosidase